MSYTKGDPGGREKGTCDCPQVSVDVVIFTLGDDALQVLLVRRRKAPYEGQWAIPGGAVAVDETLGEAAACKLEEVTGLGGVFMEQLYTFGQPGRDPRRRTITVAYYAAVSQAVVPQALVPRAVGSEDEGAGAGEGEEVRWWPVGDLPPLAFDHEAIVNYAVTRLRYKLEYTAVGFELLPETFALSELQASYEIVLGEALDKRNFRRKILGAGVIEAAGGYRGGEGRPAQLFRYREDAVAEVKARRLFP